MASGWGNEGMVIQRGAASGARMALRGTKDGQAFRGHVLERSGVAWFVMYLQPDSASESEIDLHAEQVLTGLDFR